MKRKRLRELGISIGEYAPGTYNAITDVPGVWVGQTTLNFDEPRIARTGVTVIVPREGRIWTDYCFAGFHWFNGNGEMTGLAWVEESGLVTTPVAITNTHQVGIVRDALIEYAAAHKLLHSYFLLPIVAETYDGILNDIDAFHLTREHVYSALAQATGGPVAEGNVGGGTGMRCHGFKGGIGTSSRVVPTANGVYTVGALVQANYGEMRHLRINGVPVGEELIKRGADGSISASQAQDGRGSIIIVVATDAPLIPTQCRRLAQRATVGLARVGGVGHNSSGDLFLAFSTGNHIPALAQTLLEVKMMPHEALNPLFEATAEAVEEAILNALTMAETMRGFKGVTQALPLDAVQEIMKDYRRLTG